MKREPFTESQKTARKKSALLVVLALLLSSIIHLSCSSESHIQAKGTILIWYVKQVTYDVASHQVEATHSMWESQVLFQILSYGPDSSLIVSITDNGAQRFMYKGILAGPSVICEYSIDEDSYSLISNPNDSTLRISSLDYNELTNEYVFCGNLELSESIGVYRLDSTFNVIEDLVPKFSSSITHADIDFLKVFRIDKNKYLFQVLVEGKSELYMYDDSTGQLSHVTDGWIKCLSRNKEFAIISRGYKKQQNHYLLRLTEGFATRLILEKVNAVAFAFSPDNEHVAFLVQTYDLRNRTELWLQDLTTLERENTGQYARGSIMWIK